MSTARRGSGVRRLRGLALLCAGAVLAAQGCASTPVPGTPHPSLARLWRSYQALPAERALAIAGDPRRQWVAGFVGGQPNRDDAERIALTKCHQRRTARRLQVPCHLYAVGDEIVWQEW